MPTNQSCVCIQRPEPPRRKEDDIVRHYWPKDMGEPTPWFRAAISDAFDTGIAFAVHREQSKGRQ